MNKLLSPTRLVLEHIVFWLFMFLFVFDYHFWRNNWVQALGDSLLEVASYAVVVYFNLWLLMPFLWQKKRFGTYILSTLALSWAYVGLLRITGWEQLFYEMNSWRNICSMLLNTSLFLLISTLYWYSKQGQIAREQQLILQNEKLDAELKFLRTQISPHFIFNTLNNIYALTLEKHENAAPMVAKLSAILRYLLYEGNCRQVLLKKEIEILTKYIDLFLLKKPRSRNIDFFVEGNSDIWHITPMLLLNLVENALKHSGIDQNEKAWVKIHGEIDEYGTFSFLVENYAPPTSYIAPEGGIGLANLRRQLAINFADRHHLSIKTADSVYRTLLRLQLTSNT